MCVCVCVCVCVCACVCVRACVCVWRGEGSQANDSIYSMYTEIDKTINLDLVHPSLRKLIEVYLMLHVK